MITLVELLSSVVGIIIGLVVPPVITLLNYVILSPVKKKERNEETTEQRADEGAVECLAILATLEELIPRRASLEGNRHLDDANFEELRKCRDEHDTGVAQFESSVFLLNESPRKARRDLRVG
jgi:hypothetical protein